MPTSSERIKQVRQDTKALRAFESARSAYPAAFHGLHIREAAKATGLSVMRVQLAVAAAYESASVIDWQDSAQTRAVVDPQDYDLNRWNLH